MKQYTIHIKEENLLQVQVLAETEEEALLLSLKSEDAEVIDCSHSARYVVKVEELKDASQRQNQ